MPAYIERPRPGTPASRRDRRHVFVTLEKIAAMRSLAQDLAGRESAEHYKAEAWRGLQHSRAARLIAGDRLP